MYTQHSTFVCKINFHKTLQSILHFKVDGVVKICWYKCEYLMMLEKICWS